MKLSSVVDFAGLSLNVAVRIARRRRTHPRGLVFLAFDLDDQAADGVRLQRISGTPWAADDPYIFMCEDEAAALKALALWEALARQGLLPQRGVITSTSDGAFWMNLGEIDSQVQGAAEAAAAIAIAAKNCPQEVAQIRRAA